MFYSCSVYSTTLLTSFDTSMSATDDLQITCRYVYSCLWKVLSYYRKQILNRKFVILIKVIIKWRWGTQLLYAFWFLFFVSIFTVLYVFLTRIIALLIYVFTRQPVAWYSLTLSIATAKLRNAKCYRVTVSGAVATLSVTVKQSISAVSKFRELLKTQTWRHICGD